MANHKNLGKVAQPSYLDESRFRAMLNKLGYVTLHEISDFLRIHPRTVGRMLAGDTPIDARTAMLLHVLVKFKIDGQEAYDLLEM